MSCDNNAKKAHAHFNGAGSAGAIAFGSTDAAVRGMDQIIQVARNQAQRQRQEIHKNQPAQREFDNAQRQATLKTARLFRHWKKMLGPDFQEPAHGAVDERLGIRLPEDKNIHFGYATVYDTMDALHGKGQMPEIAQRVIEASQRRQFKATGKDQHGLNRCSQCGRFASNAKTHLCPLTTSPQKMSKALSKRLGLPATAYTGSVEAQQRLRTVINEAHETGSVFMVNPMTGERVSASLDGVLLGMQQGYVPEAWYGIGTIVQSPTTKRLVPALFTDTLNAYRPDPDASPEATAAAAYGTPATALAPLATGSTTQPVMTSDQTTITGGAVYTEGRFIGSLFRKKSARGTSIHADGQTYTVGQNVGQNPRYQGQARRLNLVPPPPYGIAVGRAIVEGAELLRTAVPVLTNDGVLELYSANREALLAVYDPKTGIAGDTDGTTFLSPAQTAAVIAYRAKYGDTNLDAALSQDYAAMKDGTTTALALADGGYLAIKHQLEQGKTLKFGGQIGTQRCPQCGQFMGNDHNCPHGAKEPLPSTASNTATTSAVETMHADTVTVQADAVTATTDAINAHADAVTVQADAVTTTAETMAVETATMTVNPQTVTITVDSSILPGGSASSPAAVAPSAMTTGGVSTSDETAQALRELTQTLSGLLPALVRQSEPMVADPSKPSATPPTTPGAVSSERAGLRIPVRPEGMPLTAQEHILAHVAPPAPPDPYLSTISARVGGDLPTALDLDVPEIDPNYEVDESSERALKLMSSALQVAWSPDNAKPQSHLASFGLYGPPGTGKNTLARQMAASLKMPYVETTINPDTSAQDEIGRTILEDGSTRAQLGKIGLAAAAGSVICINEIVRNPKMATAFQSMMEDRVIEVQGTEGGITRIPVHPSTVFVMTWNPGMEGDSDRPAGAPLARMMAIPLERPSIDQQADRLMADFYRMKGKTNAAGGAEREKQRQAILAQEYKIHPIEPTPQRAKVAARFMGDLQAHAREGDIAIGGTNIAVGPREARRFMYMVEATRDPELALEQLKIYVDQDSSSFQGQWNLVRQAFKDAYGADGKALFREAPAMS